MIQCWWIKECRTLDTESGHKLCVDFWLCGGSAPLTPELIKGQLVYTKREMSFKELVHRILDVVQSLSPVRLCDPMKFSMSRLPCPSRSPGVCSKLMFTESVMPSNHQILCCLLLGDPIWTAACQASLSFTISLSLLRLISVESVMPSNHLILFHALSSCLQSFPVSGSFPVSWLFASGGQSIGTSASASILPRNIQSWFPLGWTGWISLQSKGLSRVFSSTTVQKHKFFSAQPSLWSNSHIHTWLLEKSSLWCYRPLSAK